MNEIVRSESSRLGDTELELDVRRYFQDQARRQPKRARTRAVILDGVAATIAKYGLEGTSVREIIEAAGISHGTFYNHFETKDDAIRAAASAVAGEIVASVPGEIKQLAKPDDIIVAATYAFMATAIQRPDWAKILAATVAMMDASHDPSAGKLDQMMKIGHASGVFRTPITPLLSVQVRAIQALAISNVDPGANAHAALAETCEAILRLLGRTPREAKSTVKATLARFA